VKGISAARRGTGSWPLSDLRVLDHSECLKIFASESETKERGVDFTIDLSIKDIDQIVRFHARRSMRHVKRLHALLAQIEYSLLLEEENSE
jgi:hypothetical protein